MGMPATLDHYWTAAELRALPDDEFRHECIDGVHIVTPAPRAKHQRALAELFVALRGYLEKNPVGEVLFSPADIELIDGTLVQPDLFVTRHNAAGRNPREWPEMRALHLAIEVLSPSTARYDRGIKRPFFQRADVGEYWIVDLDARLIERWSRDDERPLIATGALSWTPSGVTEPFTLDVAEMFRSVLDDLGPQA